MVKSRIVLRGAGFLIEANGELLPPYAYLSYQPAKACYASFREAGVKLFSVAVYAGDRGINLRSGIRPFRPGFWKGPDMFDFSAVDEDFRLIVGGAKPGEVYLLPRLMLELPNWWEDAHPGALCRDVQGTPLHVSYSAPEWLEACREAMERFHAWLGESGWDQYVVGWHLAGGSTEEFIRPLLHPMHFLDDSEPARRHFGQWLAAQYASVGALNAAWGTAYADFGEATPATPAERAYALRGELRDEPLERRAIDYYRFHSEALADAVIALCRAAKEITGGQQVMGAFYGYTVNIDNPDIGHHAARKVFASDAVDFLASPFTYIENRAQGMDWPFQAAVESAMLHGKPWFMEADVRTYLTRTLRDCMPFANPIGNGYYDEPVWIGPKTEAGSLGQIGKAFAKVLTHGTAAWWFDMWGGWYETPAMMAFQKQAAALYQQEMLAGEARPAAQLAVFLDETLYAALQPGGLAAHQAVFALLKQLGFVGAPYHTFLRSDLPKVDPAQYRMAIFPFDRGLSPEESKRVDAWKGGLRTLLFTGPMAARAFGDAAGAQDIPLSTAVFEVDGEPFPGRAPLLPNEPVSPGAADVVLRGLAGGEPALVLRRAQTHQIAACVPLVPPADILRDLALLAGAHIYAFDGDVVYANSRFVAIHAATSGGKRLYLPGKGSLADAFTGERLEGCDTFTDFAMAFGETRLFRVCWR